MRLRIRTDALMKCGFAFGDEAGTHFAYTTNALNQYSGIALPGKRLGSTLRLPVASPKTSFYFYGFQLEKEER